MKSDEKGIIVRLIRDDLVSYKLLSGIERLGLEPGTYYLHLGETILLLMGFTKSNWMIVLIFI